MSKNSGRIISKKDAEILEAASKILKRLETERLIRYKALINVCGPDADAAYESYSAAKKKLDYFDDVCRKHNVIDNCGNCCILVSTSCAKMF